MLVGPAGIAVWFHIGPRRPNARLVVQIGFFLAMSAMLLDQEIAPHEPAADGETFATATLRAASPVVVYEIDHLRSDPGPFKRS